MEKYMKSLGKDFVIILTYFKQIPSVSTYQIFYYVPHFQWEGKQIREKSVE